MVVAIARWLVNPGEEVWLIYRRVQVVWLGTLMAWSLLVRIALRRGLLLPDAPVCCCSLVMTRWRISFRLGPMWPCHSAWSPISPLKLELLLNEGTEPLLVALSPSRRHHPSFSGLIERLEMQDPRLVQTISVIHLFEKQQERLPPALLADSGLSYDEMPWAAPFSVQAQLKRLADLL